MKRKQQYYESIEREAAAARARDAARMGVEVLTDSMVFDATEAAVLFITTLERVVDKLLTPIQREKACRCGGCAEHTLKEVVAAPVIEQDAEMAQNVSELLDAVPAYIQPMQTSGVRQEWTREEEDLLLAELERWRGKMPSKSAQRVLAAELGRSVSSIEGKLSRLRAKC